MSASEEVPASPRDHRYVTLHLHLPSGEFVVEDAVPIGQSVEEYGKHLEEGLVTPKLGIDRVGDDIEFVYELVWNDMVLQCGRKFEDLVEDHGMSVDEPVVVVVVLKEIGRFRNGRWEIVDRYGRWTVEPEWTIESELLRRC